MLGRRSSGWEVSCFLIAFLLLQQFLGLLSAQPSKASPWLTLTGNAPAIIAEGGFSGLFPDSSHNAYKFAMIASSPATILWCDVRLTKDEFGICLPDIKLDNCTGISSYYPEGKKVYLVNGVPTPGWFSVDYNLNDLVNLTLKRSIYSRTDRFDLTSSQILTVQDIESQFKPPGIWLNIQHDIFYRQHNLNMRSYVLSVSRQVVVNYISSPEVDFLSSIAARFRQSTTKLIFRFLDEGNVEPSRNQTYGSLLKNLTLIKTFASGVLVPKHYIWPVTSDNYLQPYTSVVMDAHKAGLEIYAADFANDDIISYNYSYDPLAEYLSFIDNGVFSVDGVLSGYPITPSEAIGCFSHINKSSTDHGKPLIISHNGASGDYPDCTDLAYQKAVTDGADVIDCPVQVTKDGIPICMSFINLMADTTVTNSPFRSRTSIIPGIPSGAGIFTFNLTWDEIQKSLEPVIQTPEKMYNMFRNPRNKNVGNFMRLSDFLAFAKGKAISGVLISIENAEFMAEKLGKDIVDAVITALDDAGYNNQTSLEVMIQSPDSSVLKKFKQQTKYMLIYNIVEIISDANVPSLVDIKQFADSVAIDYQSIYPKTSHFITGRTEIVDKLHKAGLSVYVHLLNNEHVSQAWDFFADAIVQINTFVQGAKVDGIITDFPGKGREYKRNSCSKLGNNTPSFWLPVEVGDLLQLIAAPAQPPALPPMPVLNVADVVEPPLPAVASTTISPSAVRTAATPASHPSGGSRCSASAFISLVLFCGALLLI